jgi:hypothetical protein
MDAAIFVEKLSAANEILSRLAPNDLEATEIAAR